jgi:RNA polymerase sigma factor (sigma-70 family)
MSTDAELLHRYVEEHDEHAFAELVQRHLGLVYSAALRRTGGRTHLAEDIAQKVFSDLARKAVALLRHPSLTGWLHRSTRYVAIDAVRAELRRERLAQSLTAMPDQSSPPELPADWERLRPVLDEAMDQLKDRDRELVLLRYFNGLTFGEVGARLALTENAARMRAERALDQLRAHLGKRGVTSTTAALGLLLTNQSIATMPAGLATAVTTAALATAPAGVAASLVSLLLMSKLTVPAISAALAAGLTAVVWTAVAQDQNLELSTLRKENERLTQATAADAPASSVAAVADEYAAQATAIARAMTQRQAERANASAAATQPAASVQPAVTARGHSNHGQATAHDAALTFAWACDISDPDALADLIYFDGKAREKALDVLATMPESIRAQFRTPEKFYGLLVAASTLEAPPPAADLMERIMVQVELSPGRVATRRVGSSVNYHEYQQTSEGWKYVLPEAGVKGLPGNLNSETLAKLAKH